MKYTPLNQIHKQLGARMVEFAGWEMPVQYDSALQEHRAVRSAAGIFDVSHMGEIEIKGTDALKMAQKVTCNDVARLADGQAQYSAFLYPEGTFVDDIILYRIHSEHIFICVNAANKDKDFDWVKSHEEGQVEILDRSDDFAQIALQGPRASEILQPLTDTDLSELSSFHFVQTEVGNARTLLSRTGYTGEDGFELYLPPEDAGRIWLALSEKGGALGLKPAGLAARNSLRLEMCYPLYGNDIDRTTTPWEAGLGWIVKLNKGDFIGRGSLESEKREGIKRKLVGFELVDRGIVRDHYPVYLEDDLLGPATSGGFSPSLEKSVGLVYVPVEIAKPGQPLQVEIRGRKLQAKVVETPFLKRV